MISGLGEIIKYAFTTNIEFFNFVSENIDLILAYDENALEKVITDSVNYKASVVSQDEKNRFKKGFKLWTHFCTCIRKGIEK